MANVNRETIVSEYQRIVNTFKIKYVASVVVPNAIYLKLLPRMLCNN